MLSRVPSTSGLTALTPQLSSSVAIPSSRTKRLTLRMTAGFARLDQKMDEGFVQVDGRFARLERKIDQIIDLQLPKPPMGGSDKN